MKKLFTLRTLIITSLIAVPLLVSAQSASNVTQGINTVGGIVNTFTNSIVKSLATLFATAAMAAFFYGIVQYIWGIREGVAANIEKGQKFMVWGLIALFVMFSVWGIVQYAQNIFGIQGQNTIVIPSINIQPGAGNVLIGNGLPGGLNTNYSGLQNNNTNTSTSGRPNGYSCTTNSQCATSFCDPVDNTCTAVGSGALKPNGYSCTSNSQCESSFCDSVDNTCTAAGNGALKPNGYSCTSNSQCSSSFCDPVDNTCTTAGNGALKPNGYSCTSNSQCESSFCDPADNTCTAAGNSANTNFQCSGIATEGIGCDIGGVVDGGTCSGGVCYANTP